jgi:hypothetical protein
MSNTARFAENPLPLKTLALANTTNDKELQENPKSNEELPDHHETACDYRISGKSIRSINIIKPLMWAGATSAA